MGSSQPRKSSLYGDNCKYLCNSDYEKLCCEKEDCDHGTELEDLPSSRIHKKDNIKIKELDDFNGIHNLSGSDECLFNNKSSISQDETRDEADSEEKYQVTCALEEHYSKTEVCRSSEKEGYSLSSISIEALPSASAHAGTSPEPEMKLISAMKGSRAREGLATNTKLSVKWAPDVYDPPPTAELHTVKGCRRHSELTRKDYYKQKYSKSSSSRSHSGVKKQFSRRSSRSSTDPRILRLKALHEGVLTSSSSVTSVGVLNYAQKMQELKCCGSIFNESLASVHFSLAEAS